MDFGDDPKVADIGDEYMFGPAFLVAPVTDQGMTTRQVYLPAGTDWYNYWTNERIHGGQTITAQAPIDEIPLFVRAGSIIPLGTTVESTNDVQKIASVKVYPGADGDFDLYTDDGTTYAYEQGKFEVSKLHWSDATGKLTHSGAPVGFAGSQERVEVVGR
jgi:alpha-glucosidase (family GH31 glycosyl hydrolase)